MATIYLKIGVECETQYFGLDCYIVSRKKQFAD